MGVIFDSYHVEGVVYLLTELTLIEFQRKMFPVTAVELCICKINRNKIVCENILKDGETYSAK